jgi:hypothetical protein
MVVWAKASGCAIASLLLLLLLMPLGVDDMRRCQDSQPVCELLPEHF